MMTPIHDETRSVADIHTLAQTDSVVGAMPWLPPGKTEVDLNAQLLGAKGAKQLAEELKINRSVKRLHLHGSGIGANGAAALARAVVSHPTLVELNLDSDGMKWSRRRGGPAEPWRAQQLVAPTINSKHGKHLVRDKKRQNKANLKQQSGLVKKPLPVHGAMPWLTPGETEVNLYNKGIGDKGAKKLARELKDDVTVRKLSLYGSDIGNIGAAALANECTLEKINLGGNRVSDKGAAALADMLMHNPVLKTLNLGCNCIGADGAIALANAAVGHPTLEKLYLDYNKVSDAGAGVLASMLTENSILKALYLQSNSLTDASLAALAAALETNTSLTILGLDFNIPGPAGEASLSKIDAALSRNREEAQTIAAAKAAEYGSTNEHKREKADTTRGKGWVGGAAGSGEERWRWLAPGKTEASLDSKRMGDKGAKEVAVELKINMTVRTLDLRYTGIGADGATALAKAVVGHPTLEVFLLTNNHVGDVGAVALATMLTQNHILKKLDLTHNKLTEAGMASLAASLETNSSLTMLGLDINNPGSAGEAYLAKIDAKLRRNREKAKTIAATHSVAPGPAVINGRSEEQPGADSVRSVAADDNARTTEAGALTTVTDALAGSGEEQWRWLPPEQAVVDLYGKRLGDKGAEEVAEELQANMTVKTLGLGFNGIGAYGAAALAKAVESHPTLEVLELGNNHVSDAGAKALAAMLTRNSGLKTLWLTNNKLTDKGLATLEASLEINTSLTRLYLTGNRPTGEALKASRTRLGGSAKIDAALMRNQETANAIAAARTAGNETRPRRL